MKTIIPPQQVAEFHQLALQEMLVFMRRHHVTSMKKLNALNARKLLDEPLWKILEVKGKYGGRYISEGVYLLEQRFATPVRASSGQWPKAVLQKHLGEPQESKPWSTHEDYSCVLEHVNERSRIIEALLADTDNSREILGQYLFGCVVLKSEHGKLASHELVQGDPWVRYRGKVRVWDRDVKDWV